MSEYSRLFVSEESPIAREMRAAFLRTLCPEDDRLVQLLNCLHDLQDATPDSQSAIMRRIKSISILTDTKVKGEIKSVVDQIASELSAYIKPITSDRIHDFNEIGISSGILRRIERKDDSEVSMRETDKIQNIINVAFLAGYACNSEQLLILYSQPVKYYAKAMGIAHYINPYLSEGDPQYDPEKYVGGYLNGLMRCGFEVGQLVRNEVANKAQ